MSLWNVAWPLPSSKRWMFYKDNLIVALRRRDVKNYKTINARFGQSNSGIRKISWCKRSLHIVNFQCIVRLLRQKLHENGTDSSLPSPAVITYTVTVPYAQHS